MPLVEAQLKTEVKGVVRINLMIEMSLLGRKISQWFWGRGTDRSRGGCEGR